MKCETHGWLGANDQPCPLCAAEHFHRATWVCIIALAIGEIAIVAGLIVALL